jgi:hypothetical protein
VIARAALVAVLLSGCAAEKVVTRVERVEVPVSVPCRPAEVARPALATDALALDAGIWDQMRALRAERLQLRGYAVRLEAALAGCR